MSEPDRPQPVEAAGGPAETPGSPVPGGRTFTIEGRAAPGLFVFGWIATILGGVATFVGLAAEPSLGKAVLLFGGLVVLGVGLVTGAGSQAMERRSQGARYGGPSPFLLFAASIPLTLAATNAIAVPLVAVGVSTESPILALASVTITALIYLGLIRLLVVDHGALSWADMGVTRTGRAASFAGGALFAVPAIVVTSLLALVVTQVLPLPPSPLPPSGDAIGIVSNVLAAAIIAPLGEELFFRGYATTAWARATSARRALIVGSLFFALAHVLGVTGSTAAEALGAAVTAFVARLPIAFLLGWIFLQRRTIWASIGLHSTFNLILVVVAFAADQSGIGPAVIGR